MNAAPQHFAPQQFASDNYAGICPEAWAAMDEARVPTRTRKGWQDRRSRTMRKTFVSFASRSSRIT